MVAGWSGMRIIALPLTTRASSRASNTVLPLTYYHFQPPSQVINENGKENLVEKVISKASGAWAGFGKASEGHWKRRVFVYGQKLVDRIDFEELSLQGVDPSLGPPIGQLRRRDAKTDEAMIQIPLFYPPLSDLGHQSKSPLPHMQLMLARRTPHHRQGFYKWLFIAPLTAPLALIPVIPNLAFFYAAWRAWSHYRAWKASEYLQGLITTNHVIAQPCAALDEVYASYAVSQPFSDQKPTLNPQDVRSESKGPSSKPSQPRLLLSGDAIPLIRAIFTLPESAEGNILRAIDQARVRIEKL